MPTWVLDENVFKRSLEAACTRSGEDLDAATVLSFVQMQGTWVFTHALREKYLSNWRSRACDAPLTTRMFESLRDLMWDSDRSALLDNVPIVDGRYHDDDEFVVSAAAAAGRGAILVTNDGRLRDALARAGIPVQYGFDVVDVAGALILQGGFKQPTQG